MPVKEQPGVWALTTEDSLLRIPQDFQEGKRASFGQHGTICYYAEDALTELPNTCRRVTANHVFRYTGIDVTEEGYLTFAQDEVSKLLAEGRNVKLLVLDNCDTVYTATATAKEVFDPADLISPEEELRQKKVEQAAKAGAFAAGVVAAVAAVVGITKLFGKRNKRK